MTEQKKSPNPFINMANASKNNNTPKPKNKGHNIPKPIKGFSSPNVVRRSGRGG